VSDGEESNDGSALVIGGCGGIGSAVTRRLLRARPVVATYSQRSDRAARLAAVIGPEGPYALVTQQCDATDEGSIAAAFSAAQALGEVTTVVFCAGGWSYPRISDLTAAAVRAEVDLNLVSGLLVLAESARRITDGGRIVLLSSAAAAVAPPRQAVYAAAKAGLEVAARVAAKELGRRRVTVNVVRPGATDTETLREGTSDKAITAMAAANAMGRLGTPDDIADAVELLLQPGSAWITGTTVDATGGLY
jgi:3-oxoacyl-[acyl-carrier protein] reductase